MEFECSRALSQVLRVTEINISKYRFVSLPNVAAFSVPYA